MDECSSSSSSSTTTISLNYWQDYVSRTECILTYGGHSPVDLWLNYGLLSINLLVCGLWLWNRRGDEFHRFAPAFGSLVFAVAFQIVLCLQVGCSGISIVWCACFGWFLYKFQFTPEIPELEPHSHTTGPNTSSSNDTDVSVLYASPDIDSSSRAYSSVQILVGALNVALVIYYFITAPAITTVAHVCAIWLGTFLALSEECCPCRQEQQQNDHGGASCCRQWLFLDNFLSPRQQQQQQQQSTSSNNIRPSRSDDPLLQDQSSSANLFASPEESFQWNSSRRTSVSSSAQQRSGSSSWLLFSTILCGMIPFVVAADKQQADKTLNQPTMIDITCPATLEKSENDFDGYWETYLDMNSDNAEDLENFRLRGFDYRVHAYWQLKHMMKLWKHAYFGNVIQNGDAIYESASGQGLNLLLTLEILHEQVGLSNITVYGNDYLESSVALSHQLLNYAHEPWFHKGVICQGDSTDLAHVPTNAFDFVYTGFIDPLVDPLNLLGGKATLPQTENMIRHLCASGDQLHAELIQLMQEKQNEWFAKWVHELVRIVQPGGYVVVEDIGWPMCNGAMEEWGGVDPSWWNKAIDEYKWDVYPESLDIVERPWYSDRYNIRMRKRTENGDASVLEHIRRIQNESKEIYDASYLDWLDWSQYWEGAYTEELGEDYLLQHPEYDPEDEDDEDEDANEATEGETEDQEL